MRSRAVHSGVLIATFALALFPSGASAAESCSGRAATLVGTPGRDVIRGTTGPDVIVSLGGNDVIIARGGDDRVCMGPGNDAIRGRGGRDRIFGEAGRDYIAGDIGDDVVVGGPSADRIDAGAGNDAVLGGLGNDGLFGNGGADRIRGEAGSDFVSGHAGDDELLGGPGVDLVDGAADDDRLDGGPGFDYASFLGGTNPVDVSLASGTARGQGSDRLVAVEGLVGSDSELSDTLVGNAAVNWIYGGQGFDLIDGAGGDDRLFGEEDRDHLIGGTGADSLDGGPAFDRCVGGETLVACEILAYTLSVSANGLVTSSPAGIDCGFDCEEGVQPGDEITLTAHESAGSDFIRWYGGPCDDLTTLTCQFTVSGDVSITAVFESLPRLDVVVSPAAGGSVVDDLGGISCGADCSEHYRSGTDVRLTATATEGWRFAGWSGAPCPAEPSCTVRMAGSASITATFVRQHALSVALMGNGSGTVVSTPPGISCGQDCEHRYDEGTTVTLTASAEQGSIFTGWGGDCSHELDTTCDVVLDEARSVSASFESAP